MTKPKTRYQVLTFTHQSNAVLHATGTHSSRRYVITTASGDPHDVNRIVLTCDGVQLGDVHPHLLAAVQEANRTERAWLRQQNRKATP